MKKKGSCGCQKFTVQNTATFQVLQKKNTFHFISKKKKKKTFAHNLLAPVIQDVHVFLYSVEKKLRFLMKSFQDFLHIMDFNGNRTVQGPKDSFSANFNLFKGL